ncbi:MAG: MATE family efflux transporter [Patescibacteria group bacterium]|nr:MATE family efflux transporter [Patescibacteria group bacterium]
MSKHQESLANEKIPRLLLKQSMPAAIGLLVMSLYNIVDTIFIGHFVGTLAIAGLAIAFPIQMITMAISQSFGIGAASIISRALGSKNFKKAELVLGNFFSLVLIGGVLTTVVGLVFLQPILLLFGSTETILPYASEYMSVIFLGSVFIYFAAGSNNIIRSEGAAKFSMMVMIASAGLNIILDPIFIFWLDMGIKGAAIATVISQAVSAVVAFGFFFTGRSVIHFHFRNLLLKFKILKEILAIGSASLGRHVAGSFTTVLINHSLGIYGGDIAIASFGVLNRMMMVILMPMFGLVQGLQPVLGYNYGAKAYDRAKEVVYLAMKIATVIAVIASCILFVFATPLSSVFSSDPELISLSAHVARIIVIAFPLIGFQVVSAGYYQALGKALPAFFLSLLRQVFLLIPLIIILPLFFELDGLFYSFPIADFLAAIITFFMIKKDLKVLG